MGKQKLVLILVMLIFAGNIFAQSGWQWQNPSITGNSLSKISFVNSQTGFCVGEAGTLLRTSDSGLNWSTIRLPINSKCSSINFIDLNTGIIVGDNSKILRTTNSGYNWSVINSPVSGSFTDVIFPNSNMGLIFGGGAILKSSDQGLNWVNVSTFLSNLYSLYKADYLDANNIFVVGTKTNGLPPPNTVISSVILKSTNGGANWSETNLPGINSLKSVKMLSANNIICVGNGNPGAVIYKSTDFGNSWANKAPVTFENMSDITFFDQNTGVAIATSSNGRKYRTTNGGENWSSTITDGFMYNSVAASSLLEGFMVGNNGCFLKTTNAGSSWSQINKGIETFGTFFATQFFDENTGYVVGVGYNYPELEISTSILKTTNGGMNWIFQSTTDLNVGAILDVTFFSPNSGFASGDGFILKTVNGGINWNRTIVPGGLSISFPDSLNGISAGGYDISRTNNGGASWFNQYHVSSSLGIYLRGCHFINSLTGTVVGSGKGGTVLRTTNGGGNWISQSLGLSNATQYNMDVVYFLNENTGFIGGEYSFRTTNGGTNWLPSVMPTYANRIKFINLNTGFVVTDGASIYKTTNQGVNFTEIPTGTSKSFHGLSFINENTGFIVGSLLTILKTTTGGLVNINNVSTSTLENFLLKQNYPNPFNPSTKINYELRNANYVSLKVFDLLGKEIASLVNEKQNAGSYAVDFNSFEFNLPSGIYFYTLNAGEFKETKKMVLVK